MIRVTRNNRFKAIVVTVKACGLYANVSCGKSAQPKATKGWTVPAHCADWQVSKLATKAEKATAEAYAHKLARIVMEKDPKNYEGNYQAFSSAYGRELRRLIELRRNKPSKWKTFLALDAFGAAACFVLAFSAFLSY